MSTFQIIPPEAATFCQPEADFETVSFHCLIPILQYFPQRRVKSVSTQLIACSCYSGGGWEENTDCGIVRLAEDYGDLLRSSPTWGHVPSLSPQLFCHRWNNCPSTAAKQRRHFLSVPRRPSQCVLCSASQQLPLSFYLTYKSVLCEPWHVRSVDEPTRGWGLKA